MTERVNVEDFDMDFSTLQSDEEIDEIYRGAPESFSDAGDESPEVDLTFNEAGAPSLIAEPGNVLLINVKYPFEQIFLDHEAVYEGKVVFDDGWLQVREDVVPLVQAAAPHVFVEPSDTSGHVFNHAASGFATRNAAAYDAYLQKYYDNL
jgi:hypothetical protein